MSSLLQAFVSKNSNFENKMCTRLYPIRVISVSSNAQALRRSNTTFHLVFFIDSEVFFHIDIITRYKFTAPIRMDI